MNKYLTDKNKHNYLRQLVITILYSCMVLISVNGCRSAAINTTIAVHTVQATLILPSTTVNVGIGTPITLTFNTPVESSTVNSSSFMLGTTAGESQVIASSIVVGPDNLSATFTPSALLAYGQTYYLTLNSNIKDESGYPLLPYSSSFSTQTVPYTIYTATNADNGWNGNLYESALATYPNDSNINSGIAAADAYCQHDAQCLNRSICKAIIVESSGLIRQAAPTPVNWVLQAYTAYQNESETVVGITGLPLYPNLESAANPAVFSFPIAASFNPNLNTPTSAWTGINSSDWSTESDATCSSWNGTTNNGLEWVMVEETIIEANVPIVVIKYVGRTVPNCLGRQSLICVQQVP